MARTVAQWRAQLEHCPLVLGSATPSLETWVQCCPLPKDPEGSSSKVDQSSPPPEPGETVAA